jgi:hypothetical protein
VCLFLVLKSPNCRVEVGKACALRETVEETGFFPFQVEEQTYSRLLYWMTWRTPSSKEIYPVGWDMQIFACETDNISRFNSGFGSSEVLGAKWMDIGHIMRATMVKSMFLAPPQWYMLNEMSKYGRPVDFLRSITRPNDLPAILHPRLVQDTKDPELWHSILPGDQEYASTGASKSDLSHLGGPLNRMIMRKIGLQKFCDFRLIRR